MAPDERREDVCQGSPTARPRSNVSARPYAAAMPSGARSTTHRRPLERLDAESVQGWFGRAADALERAATAINALNVFPVPDRDTGTNMLVTMRSAAAAAQAAATPSTSGVADAGARGALRGACGSSGVILAGYLRGLADGLADRVTADGPALAGALAAASDSAYAAVQHPLEGTILSVARAAALAARKDDPGAVSGVAEAAAAAATAELAATTARLPMLTSAGVVDAGGQGLVVVLDVLAHVTAGVAAMAQPVTVDVSVAEPVSTRLEFAYEVQFLLEAPVDALPVLRTRLTHLGDAVAVVAGADRHNVHVHVNDVGAAIEAALDLGRPSQIRVTRFEMDAGGD